ncbi:MAG: hypothetical protein K2H78_03730, partial [Clostridia bacterium]|nr:hypothetical protein [Clostridia bacterium]
AEGAEGDGTAITAAGVGITKGKYVITATVKVTDGDDEATFENLTIEINVTVAGEMSELKLNVNDLTAEAKYTADKVLKTGELATITALVDCQVEANTGTTGYTNRLKTGGSVATNKKAIKVELQGKATITIIYKKGGNTRTAGLYDSSAKVIEAHSEAEDSSSTLFTYTFAAVNAGTYYLGGTNGINFYEIIITPAA